MIKIEIIIQGHDAQQEQRYLQRCVELHEQLRVLPVYKQVNDPLLRAIAHLKISDRNNVHLYKPTRDIRGLVKSERLTELLHRMEWLFSPLNSWVQSTVAGYLVGEQLVPTHYSDARATCWSLVGAAYRAVHDSGLAVAHQFNDQSAQLIQCLVLTVSQSFSGDNEQAEELLNRYNDEECTNETNIMHLIKGTLDRVQQESLLITR